MPDPTDQPEPKLVTATASYMATGYQPAASSEADTEGAVQASSGTQVYRVDIQVLQSNGAPAASTDLALTAAPTDAVAANGLSATVNGASAPITLPAYSDSGNDNNVTTDASGHLTVEIDGTAHASIPQLILIDGAGGFFYNSTIITPDLANVSTLSGLQSSQIAGTAAQSFDQTQLIDANYQSPAYLDQIAQGVQNLMGQASTPAPQDAMTPKAMVMRRRDQAAAASTVRSWQAGSNTAFTLDMTGDKLFSDGVQPLSASARDSIFGHVKDFFEHVYKDGKKVLKMTLQAAEDLASATINVLIDGVEDVLQFTINTLEDAAVVVVGFLQSVAQTVERVLEWLSYVFNWKDILDTAKLIETTVTGALSTFTDNLDQKLDDAVTWLNTKGEDLKVDVSKAFGDGGVIGTSFPDTTTMGNIQTTQASQAASQNPSMNSAVSQSASQSKWAASQTLNASSSSAALALGAGLRDDAASDALDKLKAAFDKIKQEKSLDDLKSDIDSMFKTITGTIKDPSSLMSNGVADLLALIQEALDTLIDLFTLIGAAVLDLISGIVNALVELFQVQVDIPILSTVFKALTNQPMTALNLVSVLIAIPTTIVYKILYNSAPADVSVKDETSHWIKLADWAKSALEGILNMALGQAASKGLKIPNCVLFGMSAVSFGLGYLSLLEKDDTGALVYCCLGAVPLIIQGASLVLVLTNATEIEAFLGKGKAIFQTFYSAIMVLVAAGYAMVDPTDYGEPDDLPLIVTEIQELPGIFAVLPVVAPEFEISAEAAEQVVWAMETLCPVVAGLVTILEIPLSDG